jgi:hypothetical protein
MNRKPHKVQEPSAATKQVAVARESAENCRAKAHDLVRTAIEKPFGEERSLLERSAAAWSMRADLLQRQEIRLTAELPTPEGEAM